MRRGTLRCSADLVRVGDLEVAPKFRLEKMATPASLLRRLAAIPAFDFVARSLLLALNAGMGCFSLKNGNSSLFGDASIMTTIVALCGVRFDGSTSSFESTGRLASIDPRRGVIIPGVWPLLLCKESRLITARLGEIHLDASAHRLRCIP